MGSDYEGSLHLLALNERESRIFPEGISSFAFLKSHGIFLTCFPGTIEPSVEVDSVPQSFLYNGFSFFPSAT